MDYYIGMDVGGTHLRLKAESADKLPLGEYEGQGCTINLSGFDAVRQTYERLISYALKQHGLSAADCRGLCVGAAGVDSEELRERYLSIFRAMGFDASRVRVYNDCELLLYAQEGRTVVATAGTGAITVGRRDDGSIVRYGGWGHLLSDEGSGFFLVKRAMEEIIHAMDGLTSCPILTRLFVGESGLHTQHDISVYLFRNIAAKSRIARFAPIVDRAAELGDPAAIRILDEATRHIYNGIHVVADKVCPYEGAPFRVLLWGSVLVHNHKLAQQVMRLVHVDFPQAVTEVPTLSALDGALGIARAWRQ